MKIGNFYVNPEIGDTEVSSRVEAAQGWLDGMYTVIELTGDAEATTLGKRLLSGVVVLKPDAEDFVIPVQGPKRRKITLSLVPLLAEDEEATDTTRQLMAEHSTEAARFTENVPGRVYFNGEVAISPIWKGLIGLHEVKHAELFKAGKHRNDDPADHWLEEAEVFEFEHRLMEKLGGQVYSDEVGSMVVALAEANPEVDPSELKLGGPSDVREAFLNDVFGESESEREEHIRASTVWIDVALRFLGQKFPDSADLEKALFLEQIYSS